MSSKYVIICVDDEKDILHFVRSQINNSVSSDYVVEIAEDGSSALELVNKLLEKKKEIPLIIVDHLMPGMKGDALLVEVHERSPKTLCIMLTGQADLSAVANAVNHEALFRLIQKPLNKKDLFFAINEVLYRYRLEKDLEENQILLEKQNKELEGLNIILKEKMELFYRFVPIQFLKSLDIDPTNVGYIELGKSREKEVAVLFIDIRSFTIHTKNFSCVEAFELINLFSGTIAPFIEKNNGFIDKFIGDGVLSIFHNVHDCLESVFEILKVFEDFPEHHILSKIDLGFGINFGPVQMGTVGYPGRMQTTIIGKTVNIAAKIEKLNKFYGTKIILTKDAATTSNNKLYNFEVLETKKISGIHESIVLYTVSLNS